MATFPLLRENLARKLEAVEAAEGRLRGGTAANAASWLHRSLASRAFVLFCGAGISVPPPASAPQFTGLRNAVVLALVDALVERDLLGDGDRAAVERALDALETRMDLSLPPEHLFGLVRNALGFGVVSRLLAGCLDGGKPNDNHLAIRSLVDAGDARLTGVVTPNFDLYLERALAGIPLRRTIVDSTEGTSGFPLCKPHGSLDRPESIAITVDRIARPLKGAARRALQDLIAAHVVLVVGYSGWDYDLFPLLVHAGRKWNAEIAWVLYDDASMNERAAEIQLALGDRCTILSGRRRAVLPTLAGGVEGAAGWPSKDLRRAFGRIFAGEADHALGLAVLGVLVPSGVPESAGVVRRLCTELLRLADSSRIGDDETLLKCLAAVVGFSTDDPPTRLRAAELAAMTAARLGRQSTARGYERVVAGEDEDDPESRLRDLDQEIHELPFELEDDPEPQLARRSALTDLRISRAALLMELGREAEAETLARRILDDSTFPDSGVSEDAWIISDGVARWKLHAILGSVAAHRADAATAEAQYCEALDVLWRELELWELGTALEHLAYDLSGRDRDCLAAATDLAVRIARFGRDPYSELHALEWKLHYGVGRRADLERADELLDRTRTDMGDQQRHRALLRRLRKRVG